MERGLDKKNMQVISIGMASILLVGVFFIGKSFWNNSGEEDSGTYNSPDSADAPVRQTITPSDLQAKLARHEKVMLLDIRSEEQFALKHIPQSRSFPSENLINFQKEEGPLLVIIGSSSSPDANELAEGVLKSKNIEAWFLAGGFEEWSGKGYPVISSGDPSDFVDQSKVTFITKENLIPLIGASNIVILDTQSEENYKRKHIKGVVHITLDELEKRTGDIPPGKDLIVYGENEMESFRAGVRLFDLNFFTVKTLRGNDHLKTGSPLPLEP